MSVWTLFAHQLALTLLAPALWQRISQPVDRGETEAGTAEGRTVTGPVCPSPIAPLPSPGGKRNHSSLGPPTELPSTISHPFAAKETEAQLVKSLS